MSVNQVIRCDSCSNEIHVEHSFHVPFKVEVRETVLSVGKLVSSIATFEKHYCSRPCLAKALIAGVWAELFGKASL